MKTPTEAPKVLQIHLDPDLHRQFKAKAAADALSMRGAMIALIELYTQNRLGHDAKRHIDEARRAV